MYGISEASAEIARIGDELVARGAFGSVRVVSVTGELTTDHDGDAVLRLRLTLADPTSDGTWGAEDIDQLQEVVQRLANSSELDLPYVLAEFYPETAESNESDDGSGGSDLADALDRDPDA